MKSIFTFVCILLSFGATAQQQTANFSITPNPFDVDESITVTVSNINPTAWGVTDLYLWMWYFDETDTNSTDSPTNGTWTNSNAAQQLTDNGDGTYSFIFTPETFLGTSNIGSIGMLVKAKDATGDKKSQDFITEVGNFQLSLNQPTNNVSIINNGNSFTIDATASLVADFELFADGTSIDTQTAIQQYNFSYTITQDVQFELVATDTDGNQLTRSFSVILPPTPNQQPVPAGLHDGINFDPQTPNSISLVLPAPGKSYVHVIGNFNNWQVSNAYLMNYDATQEKYWITLTNLNAAQDHILFQYLVDMEINIADPLSTLILSPYNDDFIPAANFTDLPSYPSTKTTEAVSWIRKNPPAYNWQNTSFTPPAKEDLVIYELLIRDFDELQTFDAVLNRLDYLENLGVNAIELMPVSEFDGNLSWGYNPAFHMALDKYYGSPEMLKALVDECHNRGIAVILDVVYNHATGQNPLYRMYNDCNGCTSGQASATSPYFNQTAKHSYNVFNDFNHQSAATQAYVNRTLTYWMEEFKLDGFRWDLTKGFTQNCENDEACTNSYQADRVQVIKDYADTQWSINPDFYVIAEHLGNGSSRQEEIEWANYRANEGKGILFWNIANAPYNEATMGYNANADFSDVSYENIGTNAIRNVAYMESHDEERLMYKNLSFGNSDGSYDVTNLNTSLNRMKAAGAFFFSIPGPKMIWQFGELGYDTSIFTCDDGTVPQPYGDDSCKLSEKPDGWDLLNNSGRVNLHDTWKNMIYLKHTYAIFQTGEISMDVGQPNGLKSIHLHNPSAGNNDLEYVTIIGNFGVTTQNINPNFQQTGTWYNLLSGEPLSVNDVNASISLAPGEFYMYGDVDSGLGLQQATSTAVFLYPNPTKNTVQLSQNIDKIEVYNLNGQKLITREKVQANTPIDIAQLESGIYLISLYHNQQTHYTKLVVN